MQFAQLGRGLVAFPVEARQTSSVSSLAYLALVNLVIWIGLFFYVWRLDRRISRMESDR